MSTDDANIGRTVYARYPSGKRLQGTIAERQKKPAGYIVHVGEGRSPAKHFVSDDDFGRLWHWDAEPQSVAAPKPATAAKPDYQKMAADAYSSLQAMRFDLDPKAPDFDKRVAAAIKSGRVAEPVIKADAPKPQNRGGDIRAQLRIVEGAKPASAAGAKITVAYQHKKIGERGND